MALYGRRFPRGVLFHWYTPSSRQPRWLEVGFYRPYKSIICRDMDASLNWEKLCCLVPGVPPWILLSMRIFLFTGGRAERGLSSLQTRLRGPMWDCCVCARGCFEGPIVHCARRVIRRRALSFIDCSCVVCDCLCFLASAEPVGFRWSLSSPTWILSFAASQTSHSWPCFQGFLSLSFLCRLFSWLVWAAT